MSPGHKDRHKPYIVQDSETVRALSVRLILSVADLKGFHVFSHDVNQAYQQINHKLTREIGIVPKKEDRKVLAVSDDEMVAVLARLYAICDSGDYRSATMEQKVGNDSDRFNWTSGSLYYAKYVFMR